MKTASLYLLEKLWKKKIVYYVLRQISDPLSKVFKTWYNIFNESETF